MTFIIDSLVQVIDEDLTGKVVKIEGDMVSIETADGFLIRFRESELIPYTAPNDLQIIVNDHVKSYKEDKKIKKKSHLVQKKKKIPALEVDLHIHQLTTNFKRMSNFDMLNLQLDTAKRQLQFAITKKISRIIFIHGIGSGVLKEELQFLLGRYDNLRYYPADFAEYGQGATEVRIFQKSNTN